MSEGSAAVQDGSAGLSFASEDARIEAINNLGETQADLEQLDAIRSAPIVGDAGGDGGDGGQAGQGQFEPQAATQTQEVVAPSTTVPPAAAPPAAPAPAAEPLILSADDIRAAGFSYTTPADVVKALKEKEDLIQRQQKYIKERLESRGSAPEPSNAAQQIQPAAAAPSAPAAQTQQQAPATMAEAQAALDAIQAEIDALEDGGEDDGYDPFDPNRGGKVQALMKKQSQAMRHLTQLITQTASDVGSIKSASDAQQRERESAATAERYRQARLAGFAEMDAAAADPELQNEYKLSKPAVEVEADYLTWRAGVATAYYGRPPATHAEISEALRQLEAGNPVLVDACKVIGVDTTASADMLSYMRLMEAIDYRDGWRPDPANPGKYMQLKRYDPAMGGDVPITMPDVRSAITQMRHAAGVHKQQVDAAYQRGAQQYAAALAKRDPAVGELNSPSTTGQGASGAEWAMQVLSEDNDDEAMRQYRQGNTTMLDNINKARAIMGMGAITFGG